MEYKVVPCTYEKHAHSILETFNDAIENSTVIYEYQKLSLTSMVEWFDTKKANGYPIIGLESVDGQLLGFASYSAFKIRPAYKYSIEHSIYVHKDFRGHGLSHILLELIINAAKENNYHALIGGIDADNQASIALHEKHGFKHVGTLPEVGYKFGRWLNLAYYQLILPTPKKPSED